MTQKVIEGGVVAWRHMHEILRLLNFKLAQNLDHMSKLRDGPQIQTRNSEMAQNRSNLYLEFISFRILSYLRVFGPKKVSYLGVLTRDRGFEPI